MLSSLLFFVDMIINAVLLGSLTLHSALFGPTEIGPDNLDGVILADISVTGDPVTPEQLEVVAASEWGYIEAPHHVGFSFGTNAEGETTITVDGYCGETSGVVTFGGATMTPVAPLIPQNAECADYPAASDDRLHEILSDSPTIYSGSDSNGNLVIYVGSEDGVLMFVDPAGVPEWPSDPSSWATLMSSV